METTNETKAKQLVENDPEKMEASEKQEPEAGKDEKVKKKSEYEGSVVIWRGVLEWTEPIRKTLDGKPDPEKEPQKSKEIICKLLVWDLDDGINELKRNLPEKLTMTLMRKQFIRNTDKSFFSNSTRTLFDMEASDKLNSLTKFMNSGYFGCIFFSSKPNSQLPQPQLTTKNNKVCTLHYAAERQMYIGFFLNDTTNFLNRMHEIIQYQKGIETFFKPGKITVPNPVVSSFYKDFIVEEYKGELIQQLQSIPRIKEERKERAKMCHENSQSKKVRERKKFLEKQKIRQQKQLELEQEQEAEKKLDEMMKFQNEILEQMPRKIGKKVKIEGTKIEEVQQIFGPKSERLEEAVLQSEMDQLKVLVRQRLNDKQKVVKVLQNVGLKHLEEKVEKSLRKIAVQHQLKVEEQQSSKEQRKEQLRPEQSSMEHLERSLKKEASAVKQSECVMELQNNQVPEVEQQSTSKQLDSAEKQCSKEQLEQQSSIELKKYTIVVNEKKFTEQLEQQCSMEQSEQQSSVEQPCSTEQVEQQCSTEQVEQQCSAEQVEQQNSMEHVEQQSSMKQVEQSSTVLENEQKFVKQLEQQNSTEHKEQQSSTEHKKITAVLLQPQNFITQQKLVEQQSDPELQKFVKQNSMELLELENNCSENLKQSSSDELKSKDKTKKQKTDKVVILQEHKKQKEPERKKEDKKLKKQQQQQKLKEQKNLLKTINHQHNHLHHHHHVASLSGSGIVAKKIEKTIPLLVTQKHSILWQGLLEWHEKIKCPGENNKQIRFNVLCQMLSHTSATNAELKMNLWPPKLIMQLIPLQLIKSIDKNYFLKTKHIFCNLISCTTLDSLVNSMKTGKIGLILFKSDQQSTTKCDIRVFLLLYIEEKRAFFGSFPEDQITFANHLRKLIEYEMRIEAVIKQRHQRVENSNKQQTVVNLTEKLPQPSAANSHNNNNSNNNNNNNSSNNNNNNNSSSNNNISNNNNNCANGIVNSQKTEFDNLKNARQQNLIRIQLLKELLAEAEQQEVLYKSQIEINIRKNIEIARQEMKNKEEAQKGNKSNKS
ncbi:putative uncharacterized protein DDB_G0271606 isoform X2 [Cotesia glomerata]|uniref:putative uncharacterized protein DDB_G0271606 isoform X2 n=1 Tax=Cotesia glomerata TaxID=32391 RepID=UPI001D021935|nr:putative uncharacterized protein DDB_G0271606 isoform X2 [Cotesia glomerata]